MTADCRDPSRSAEVRARDLLGRMTREEKIAQLCSVWITLQPDSGEFAPMQAFGAPPGDPLRDLAHGIGQITRPFGSRPIAPREGVRALNAFQRRLIEGTRLGIPAIAHEEALTGFMTEGATQFPSPLNYGSTWDPALIRRVGDAIRRQLRACGVHQALAPVADVIRDARWGRVEECMGEDPHLVGALVSAYVAGLQGDDPRTGIVATLKHFAGYSGSEGGRNFAPLHAGPRELLDVYLVPFEMAVKTAGARSVMNAYNEVDGVPCAASRWLLTETLRERWGFDGMVVAGVALEGHDVIAYHTGQRAVPGDPAIESTYGGARYRFASQEHRARFEAEPARWVPAYGGFCGYAASIGKVSPVDPTIFQIHEGRLILQHTAKAYRLFNEDLAGSVARADRNWPGLVAKHGSADGPGLTQRLARFLGLPI